MKAHRVRAKGCEWVEGCRNEAVVSFLIDTVSGNRTWIFLCTDHGRIYKHEVERVTRHMNFEGRVKAFAWSLNQSTAVKAEVKRSMGI